MLHIDQENYIKKPNDGRYIIFDDRDADLITYNDNYGTGNMFPTHSFITSHHSGSGLPELEFDTTAAADEALKILQDLKAKAQ